MGVFLLKSSSIHRTSSEVERKLYYIVALCTNELWSLTLFFPPFKATCRMNITSNMYPFSFVWGVSYSISGNKIILITAT